MVTDTLNAHAEDSENEPPKEIDLMECDACGFWQITNQQYASQRQINVYSVAAKMAEYETASYNDFDIEPDAPGLVSGTQVQ